MSRALGLALVFLSTTSALADDPAGGLTLADLGPYRAAVEGIPKGPATPVTFRDLWDHPDTHRGRRVRVSGRVVRRFRQGAFGTFPPLVEVWAVSPSGDPFCLVFPTRSDEPASKEAAPGALVTFEGTFLRAITYQGGDVRRLAPLIVGDRSPKVSAQAPKAGTNPTSATTDTWFGWTLALAAGGFVVLALARRQLGSPSRPRRSRDELDDGVTPEFFESGSYHSFKDAADVDDERRAGP